MVLEETLAKMNEPSDWVHPMVILHKKDKVQIAIDTREINKYVKREHYKLTTNKVVLVNLTGAKFFSVLDASHAFSQIAVDEETSKKLVLGTPYGHYNYLSLPYGLSSSPEVFQKNIDTVIEGLTNVSSYMDDLIIYGKTVEEHDCALKSVLERARKFNLTLSEEKFQFRQEKLKYLGHIISSEGIKPDPAKISAIYNFPIPKDRQALHQFLGLVNFVAKFIPNLSEETKILRTLLSAKNK